MKYGVLRDPDYKYVSLLKLFIIKLCYININIWIQQLRNELFLTPSEGGNNRSQHALKVSLKDKIQNVSICQSYFTLFILSLHCLAWPFPLKSKIRAQTVFYTSFFSCDEPFFSTLLFLRNHQCRAAGPHLYHSHVDVVPVQTQRFLRHQRDGWRRWRRVRRFWCSAAIEGASEAQRGRMNSWAAQSATKKSFVASLQEVSYSANIIFVLKLHGAAMKKMTRPRIPAGLTKFNLNNLKGLSLNIEDFL